MKQLTNIAYKNINVEYTRKYNLVQIMMNKKSNKKENIKKKVNRKHLNTWKDLKTHDTIKVLTKK